MNVDALVRRLIRLKVFVCADGDALRVSAPRGLLEDGLRERLLPLKGVLMKELRREDYWHRLVLRAIDEVPDMEARWAWRYGYEEHVGLLMHTSRMCRAKAEFIAAITVLRGMSSEVASESPT